MRRTAWLVCCTIALAACSTDPGVKATDAEHSDATFDPADDPFGWTRLVDFPGVEVGTFTVPIDYANPARGKFELNIARHLAMKPDERIGSLLVNPGGPGAAGVDYALYADLNFGQPLLDRFDIVAWDPRGTGQSAPAIDCTDNLDQFFGTGDITPDDTAERQELVDLAKEFSTDCVEKNGNYLQYVGTNNSARDMDAIRAALGEATISYLGFSYGSELGGVWATLFPSTVRAAVLDGAVDPTASQEQRGVEQAEGFEQSLDTFLAQCSSDRTCPFHNGGDAGAAFDRLMTSLDESPLPSDGGRPPISLGVALTGVYQAMYDSADWPRLAKALDDARRGEGAGLLELYDEYNFRGEDGTWNNLIEAFQVISCSDSDERPTVEESDAQVPDYQAAAPRLSRRTVGDYFCTFFPPAVDPRIAITGAGAGPIVVVGTTGDPATPLEGSRKMAESLEQGRLLTVVANQHTGYLANDCATNAIESYLVDPVGHLPAEGLRCQ